MRFVKIITPPDSIAAYGTKVVDSLTGLEFEHITAIQINITAGGLIEASIQIDGVNFEGEAAANFFVDGKRIKHITFEDGEILDFSKEVGNVRK